MSNEQDARKTENEPQAADELTSDELDQVAGGGGGGGAGKVSTLTPPPVSNLPFVKVVDKSS